MMTQHYITNIIIISLLIWVPCLMPIIWNHQMLCSLNWTIVLERLQQPVYADAEIFFFKIYKWWIYSQAETHTFIIRAICVFKTPLSQKKTLITDKPVCDKFNRLIPGAAPEDVSFSLSQKNIRLVAMFQRAGGWHLTSNPPAKVALQL